jgi:serine protease inhibitor
MKKWLCALIAVGFTASVFAADSPAFALELYRLQAQRERGNMVFSPYSIATTMTIAAGGARGTTASQIRKIVSAPIPLKATKNLTLITANAVWAAKNVKFRPRCAAAARNFGAILATVDFTHPQIAQQRINAWVSDATRKKIPALITDGSLAPSTRLVLASAIYMKAGWLNPFPRRETDENGRFHTPTGDRRAAMMKAKDEFRYARLPGVRVIELPYRGSELSMLVILPDAIDGLSKIERALTPRHVAEWDRGLEWTSVDVMFPRFTTDQSIDAARSLRALGIREAFSPDADFSGMASEPLRLSRVAHKARIDVDEEGTEAAAATDVSDISSTVAPPQPE